jgi:hypothetical protein
MGWVIYVLPLVDMQWLEAQLAESGVEFAFTGLKDSTGRDIYEGYIGEDTNGLVYFVEYYRDRFWLTILKASSREQKR